jgi:hypothetical protein
MHKSRRGLRRGDGTRRWARTSTSVARTGTRPRDRPRPRGVELADRERPPSADRPPRSSGPRRAGRASGRCCAHWCSPRGGASMKSRTSTSTCMANGAAGSARSAAAAAAAGSAHQVGLRGDADPSAATCARSKSVASFVSVPRSASRCGSRTGRVGKAPANSSRQPGRSSAWASPIQSSAPSIVVFRGVHVEVAIDVEQPQSTKGGLHRPPPSERRWCSCHRARAACGRPSAAPDPIGQLPDRRHDLPVFWANRSARSGAHTCSVGRPRRGPRSRVDERGDQPGTARSARGAWSWPAA